jgi:endonuclease/exonuclease/phosphatase family metal-dependent hydrolase
MRFGVISQNLAEAVDTPAFDESSIIDLAPDLYIEMTQEDGRLPCSSSIVRADLLDKYTHLECVSLNGSQKTHQNIMINMFVKVGSTIPVLATGSAVIAPKASSLRLGLQTMAKALHTGYGYSKGMVYVKIQAGKRAILFINMHLPVKTKVEKGVLKNATLGLEFRRASFLELLNKLEKDGVLNDNPALFVSGDLNFRMDKMGRNQLNDILQNESERFYNLKELSQLNGEKRITCKFTSTNKTCRMKKIPVYTKDKHEFLEEVQSTCGNSMRTPSRCDRFLVSKNLPLSVRLNTVKYLVKDSDHNAILCCFDLMERPSTINRHTVKLRFNK